MTSGLIIRSANSNEKLVLEEVQRRASLVWDDHRKALLENPDAIELPQQEIDAGHVLVCERDRKVTGFAVILPRDDGEAELDGLFVDPSMWNCGIGRRLLDEASTVAMQRGAKTMYVIANPQALDFYQACGFTGGETRETRFGPAISMALLLNP